MRVINSIPWSSTEIESYRQIIWVNLIEGMSRVRQVIDELSIQTSEDTVVRGCPVKARRYTHDLRRTGPLRASRPPVRVGRAGGLPARVPARPPGALGGLCRPKGPRLSAQLTLSCSPTCAQAISKGRKLALPDKYAALLSCRTHGVSPDPSF